MSATTFPESTSADRPAVVPPDLIMRLSVQQYHEMIDAGILTTDDKVELLEGLLVCKMSKKPPHRLTTGLVREALTRIIPPGWYVDSQEPVTLETSEPEPDVMIVRGLRTDYADHHPGTADVALVVEVSDSTLERDRRMKKRIYARAEIPVYWIINLIENQIEVYTSPSGPAAEPDYRQRQDYGLSERVPVALQGSEVGHLSVRELLP